MPRLTREQLEARVAELANERDALRRRLRVVTEERDQLGRELDSSLTARAGLAARLTTLALASAATDGCPTATSGPRTTGEQYGT